MLLPQRILSISYKRQEIPNTSVDDNSHREHDLKRPQMTSNVDSIDAYTKNRKSKKKGGSVHGIDDAYLDEILHIFYNDL